ncbi:glutamate-5-semialdehyde dehydrogenase [Humidesulfovibrio mexicanus]|uniref:Gamma-glutamyl phosphate reductase n=1 Tax=Humidesulfovibrio mexicanus TaxID=147047 RepID=A0A239AYV9_9BACT|nr:glutamate-5-semialdehyde dehydrogenase [Humidesulfovibrio mexicanus]SNS00817.1 glutamate-5-semialdehyde dehydrogenase [Humidesulfovibrio mexicanus]
MDIAAEMRAMAQAARAASRRLAAAEGSARRQALLGLADLLGARAQALFAANARDVDAARARGLDQARLDRLAITEGVLGSMIQGCREVAAMSDPVGEIESMKKRPNGMLVGRMRVPLGVVAMIFESRPNALVDAAALCIKSGNAAILRGGSEAFHSLSALAATIHDALEAAGLPRECVQTPPTADRQAVTELLKLDEYIDVVIPRGGEGLIRAVVEQAKMPVLKHYKGVCHTFVDETADLARAVDIVLNAKAQRPGTCNALECLLVHRAVAGTFLPLVAERLGAAGVRFKCCPEALPLLAARCTTAEAAQDDDWGREFLSLTLAVKVVADLDEALEHIARFGSNHTEAILTESHKNAMRFTREADASMVAVNASTRLNDGGELGLGAEIGISTTKLHAYGPMGILELMSAKFVALGQGQIRQ